MENIGTKLIETPRLILRQFKIDDAKQMFKNYTSSEKVTEFLSWKAHKSEKDTIDYLNCVVLPKYEKDDYYCWAVVLKEINEVVGCIDVVKSDQAKKMAELGKAVLEILFNIGFVRVQALHHVDNPKSGRVMQKIGMTYEGRLKKITLDKDGKLVDCDIYAIINNNLI